jgi:outer membrane lipoprotein-sorting protein
MLRLRVTALTGCVLVLGALGVHAQDADLKAILRKSIEAHGGDKNLAKFKAVNSKFKGTIELMGAKRDITGETSFQKPDKVRNTMTIDIGGNKIDIITVYNGKKMWVSAAGMVMEINDEKLLQSVREELQVEGASNLGDFLKAPYELNAVGEVKVKGKDAIGIRVSKKGQKDITMFFDKKTHLVVKSEMRSIDSISKEEVTQEKFIVAYQDKDGMKIAKRVEIVKDGKAFLDIEITEVQPLERIDDSVFAKP